MYGVLHKLYEVFAEVSIGKIQIVIHTRPIILKSNGQYVIADSGEAMPTQKTFVENKHILNARVFNRIGYVAWQPLG